GVGTEELAKVVVEATRTSANFNYLYSLDSTPEEKIEILATKIYGAEGVDF
ncbi:formate--tetrahydrofolate ligase, partial [Vibrio parahaemolyticus]